MKPTIIYIIILTILFIVKPQYTFAKGKSGTYILTGLAISNNCDTLKNQKILMFFRDQVDTIKTDSQGFYKIEIHWAIACNSSMSNRQSKRLTKKYNSEFIFFSFKDSRIKIKNEWESFITADLNDPNSATKKEDLIFYK